MVSWPVSGKRRGDSVTCMDPSISASTCCFLSRQFSPFHSVSWWAESWLSPARAPITRPNVPSGSWHASGKLCHLFGLHELPPLRYHRRPSASPGGESSAIDRESPAARHVPRVAGSFASNQLRPGITTESGPRRLIGFAISHPVGILARCGANVSGWMSSSERPAISKSRRTDGDGLQM